MLIAFSCNNYGPFREQVVLSMEATSSNEFRAFNTIETKQGTYLKSAFIFGANGSGKTNLFKAMGYMKRMVTSSMFDLRLTQKNSPFQFLSTAKDCPTTFEMVFLIDNKIWTYGFEILRGKINKEWLYKKHKRVTTAFERSSHDWKSINLSGEWKKLDGLKEHTRDNALFLSLAAMLNVGPAIKLRNWFENLLVYTQIEEMTAGETVDLLEEEPEVKNEILSFLKEADFGIDDFDIEIKDGELTEEEKEDANALVNSSVPPDNVEVKFEFKKRLIGLKTHHRLYNEAHKEVGVVTLPFLKFQSTGTIKVFELIGPLLRTLRNGGVLIIDEMDSKLHPLLVRYIVTQFHKLNINLGNGQLICNTHDALLFDEEIRRDQFWFMKKNSAGASELYSLAEFQNVRKSDPLLKKYLVGVFGAVPFSKERESIGTNEE